MNLPPYVTPEYLSTLELCYGQGSGATGHRCAVQEVRAWLDLDVSSDAAPECMSPVIRAMLIGLNDCSPRTREKLNPILPRTVGTNASPEIDHARSLRVLDWYLREWLPVWFDLTPSLHPYAAQLRAMEQITDGNAASAGVVVRTARAAASDAAWAAASDAAWAAAWDAARAAAWAAAWDALSSTVERLQDSAIALLEELISWPV